MTWRGPVPWRRGEVRSRIWETVCLEIHTSVSFPNWGYMRKLLYISILQILSYLALHLLSLT
jgi:hypothetical protein